jgi:hypothetical protein
VNRFAYLVLLVLPSGGVYVLAGKTKCANAAGLKLQFFFVRLDFF